MKIIEKINPVIICILIAVNIGNTQVSVTDTLFNYDSGGLVDSFYPLIMGDFDGIHYYEIDSSYVYDITEIRFQFISEFVFGYSHGPLPQTFPIYFRTGNLDSVLIDGLILWPAVNTGVPWQDIYSALPGETIDTIYVTINDSTELYPNWKIIPLGTNQTLKNLQGNLWIRGWGTYFTAFDSIFPSSLHTFSNLENGFWGNSQWIPDRAIRVAVEKVTIHTEYEKVENPSRFQLLNSYPNPFNATTTIPYYAAHTVTVSLHIYNINGQAIYFDSRQNVEPGYNNFKWAGIDNRGNTVPSGVYFILVTFSANKYTNRYTSKLLFLK